MKLNKKPKVGRWLLVSLATIVVMADSSRADARCLNVQQIKEKAEFCRDPISMAARQKLNQLALETGLACHDAVDWANAVGTCILTAMGRVVKVCKATDRPCVTKEAIEDKIADASSRCAAPISPRDCSELNNKARKDGAICEGAKELLEAKGLCAISMDRELLSICPEGCFSGDTQIMMSGDDGEGPTEKSARSVERQDALAVLEVGADLAEPRLGSALVDRVVQGPEQPKLFVFGLEDGKNLRVTQEHPMVLDDGSVVRARDVRPGDSFARVDGVSLRVSSVSRQAATEDVYNFETRGEESENHVIVANGVFVGDLRLQNASREELASIQMR